MKTIELTNDMLQKRILYRDALILVIDKPRGLSVHSGSKKTNSLDHYFDALRFGLPNAPALAHRLDKDTSGCLILGRHKEALRRLKSLFETSQIEKTYWAIVQGYPEVSQGIIDLPLAHRSHRRESWWMKVDPHGKPAQTRYQVLKTGHGLTWLALQPLTGRTHQLRVHCAAMGWPIKGDEIYGRIMVKEQRGQKSPLGLHARSVRIPLYLKKDPILIEAPPPSDMCNLFPEMADFNSQNFDHFHSDNLKSIAF